MLPPIQLELGFLSGLKHAAAPTPAASASVVEGRSPHGEVPAPSRRRTPPTILVVEDEAVLRLATSRFLSRAGFRILEAANGDQALAVWQTHHDRIDLVFTDMVMPGDLNGLELARHVLASKTGIKVVLTSGYSERLLDLEDLGGADLTCLAKPCAPEVVIQTLSHHLGWVPKDPMHR